jgi:hypothetical protein
MIVLRSGRIEYYVGDRLHQDSMLTFQCEEAPKSGNRRATFLCDCGESVVSYVGHVKGLRTRSCGCWNVKVTSDRRTTHGMTDTGVYRSWVATIKKGRAGRCEHWDTYKNFHTDMHDTWFQGAVLARYGDSGIYEPGNCRWLTREENVRERHELSGEMYMCSDGRFGADVAEENGIAPNTFHMRVYKYGWTVDEACTIPTGSKRNDKTKTEVKTT